MTDGNSAPMDPHFDLVCVGSGFATTFFLIEYLKRAGPGARILVIERGRHNTHAWQVENRRNSDVNWEDTFVRDGDPGKSWRFNVGFGGGSNCWVGNVPRFLPSDFRMKSLYGVGEDWPISYDDLEPFYQEAEEIMMVSGPSEDSPFRRSRPYPQPPHRFSKPDRILKQAYPDRHFAMPTVRARKATTNRPRCCASGVCSLCPVGAKLTIENELMAPYEDPRVTLLMEAEAVAIETNGGIATSLRYIHRGRAHVASGELFALGANALFNPFLLKRSAIDHSRLGRRLHEVLSIRGEVFLDGVENFGGSTLVSGHNYVLYEGPHRRQHGACLIETMNVGLLRAEYGKWRNVMEVLLLVEDLPLDENRVEIATEDPSRPLANFKGRSDYAYRGMDMARSELGRVMSPLPVERIVFRRGFTTAGAHIQGTVMMGDDPETSVVDRHLVHHQLRNLLVLGSSAFPTGPSANPTLTLSALSLWSARFLMSG